MTAKAVIEADYVNLRFVQGRKCCQIIIEIPQEAANKFLEGFGAPDAAAPVKVAIARLRTTGPGGVLTAPNAPSAVPQGQDKERHTWTRGQRCAYQCSFPAFIEWLGCESEAVAEEVIRLKLGIRSRSELNTNDAAWREWEAIHASYELGEPYEP